MHDKNCFITLTYNDANLPRDGSLDKRHWQLFAKRLRDRVGPFRYFHCGEYGTQTRRAHYHAAIFGLDFAEDRRPYKLTKDGNQLYTSPLLEEIWGMGYAPIGELNFHTAAYVARYIMKKRTGPQAAEHYEVTDATTGEVHQLLPEYTTMSLKPAIGAKWLDRYFSDVYPADEVITNGKPHRPPRAYDKILERRDPELHRQLKLERAKRAQAHSANNTPERLAVREAVQHHKSSLRPRGGDF